MKKKIIEDLKKEINSGILKKPFVKISSTDNNFDINMKWLKACIKSNWPFEKVYSVVFGSESKEDRLNKINQVAKLEIEKEVI